MSDESNGFTIGAGAYQLSARGLTVIFVLCVAVVLGATVYVVDMMHREHQAIERRLDLLICVEMIPHEERNTFARDWKPGAWGIRCPWVDESSAR